MELETDILDHRQLYAVDAGPKVRSKHLSQVCMATISQMKLKHIIVKWIVNTTKMPTICMCVHACTTDVWDVCFQIAAASIEKLFQQLTSPQFDLRPDFLRVFLLTHSCFTTPMNVLTALLNCIKTPEDMSDRLSQVLYVT